MSSKHTTQALLFATAAAFLAYISRLTLMNNDIFHAMSLFREALTLGWIPHQDLYAFTPTVDPTVHHEWGTGALLYLMTVATGWGAAGLIGIKYLVTAAIAVGCYLCAKSRGASPALIAILAPLMFPLAWVGFGTLRAQLFTLLFLTCLLLLLEQDRRGKRWWIAVWLPLYVVWLNMHAGFVVGVGVLGLHTLETIVRVRWAGAAWRTAFRQVRHLIVVVAVMVPCLALNPYGLDYPVYLLHGLLMERPLISEWSPLWHTVQPLVTLEVFALSVILVVAGAWQQGKLAPPGLLTILVTAWLALNHTRHGSIYAIVWICYAPAYVQSLAWVASWQDLLARHARPIGVAAIVGGCLCLGWASSNRFWQLTILTQAPDEPLVYPAGAVDYLEQTAFRGNLIVPFNTGAFVSWRLYPSVKVSFDSRYEATYPPGALEENFAFYAGEEGWRESLTRHGADSVLVRRISPLDNLLDPTSGAGWQRVYQDDEYALFVAPHRAADLPIVDRRGERLVGHFP